MKQFKHQELLTKGKFKMFLDCPTQVYYYNNRKTYEDISVDDDFLMSLAKGGHQVGALAISYYPQGHNIETLDAYLALEQTNELLKQDNVVIFEAALMYENKFCRVDILEKIGNTIKIIEVKSKAIKACWFDDISDVSSELYQSYSTEKSYEGVMNKTKAFAKTTAGTLQLTSEWTPYCYDIAFQTWIANKVFPLSNVQSFLCCPDKDKEADCSELNQKFMVFDNQEGRTEIKVLGNVSPEALGESILSTVNVTWLTNIILKSIEKSFNNVSFDAMVEEASQICLTNEKPVSEISSICKSCRFNAPKCTDKKNGYAQCVSEYLNITEEEVYSNPSILEIWSFKPNTFLAKDDEGKAKFFMNELNNSTFNTELRTQVPLNMFHRQLLQVKKVKNNDNTEFLAKAPLKAVMESFTFPLNFIDFETTMVALPFNKGDKPYQTMAFQFSHHVLNQDGKCEHKTQFINLDNENPNLSFIRALKNSLELNNGTIFRWSNHENTVLLMIRDQLATMEESICSDKRELIDFILSITQEANRAGERNMVDQWQMYKDFHYMPETKGSNSIKAVLPAIMGRFESMHSVLSEEVYGKGLEYTSLNFESVSWFQKDETGKVKDPYKILPKIFSEQDEEKIERLFYSEDIKNGGMAMMAYAVSQFKMMTVFEKSKIKESLLRYCELDTFAMVLVYLYWYEQCQLEYTNEADYVIVED
jgi:hypothetical protein